jgi:hypothetical protein
MKVGGVTITDDQRAAAIGAMVGTFGFGSILSALGCAGVPYDAAYRGADRLLQQERKAGRIRFERGKWVSNL